METRQHESAAMAWRNRPTGVQEQGARAMGSSRNLGGPLISIQTKPDGTTGDKSRPHVAALRGVRSEREKCRVVSPSEGNEARREG